MRLAVLADIHSNHHAFKACMDWIAENNIDGIVFLGDYVSDCAYPQKTMELLYIAREKYRTWFVRGNREDVMIEGNISPSLGSLTYTYENLTDKDIEFFKSLLLVIEVKLDGCSLFTASHGDYHNNRENIFPDNEAMNRLLTEMPGEMHLCGHTHNAFVYEHEGKLIVNPGSVGVTHDGNSKAGMAVVEFVDGCWKAELVQIEYDVEAAVKDIFESGFYEKDNAFARLIIATIRTGHDYKADANKLYGKYVSGEIDVSDKELWDRIADELGV